MLEFEDINVGDKVIIVANGSARRGEITLKSSGHLHLKMLIISRIELVDLENRERNIVIHRDDAEGKTHCLLEDLKIEEF